jgi:hypothetical protein
VFVAIDCPREQAAERARTVLDWLVERRIVEADETDCVLGGGGHPPDRASPR